MTLPSSSRPPEVEQMIVEEEENKTEFNQDHKIAVDVKQCFMNQMIKWYNQLGPRVKDALTKKRVINYGVHVAYRLKIPYNDLPENWLKRLYVDHGVHFRFSSRCKRRRDEMRAFRQQLTMAKNRKGPKEPLSNKIVDLTYEPPPPDWLAEYTKGSSTPRVLKLQRDTEGVLVLYYDYKPNVMYVDGTGPVFGTKKEPSHDRDGVFPYPSHPTSWN